MFSSTQVTYASVPMEVWNDRILCNNNAYQICMLSFTCKHFYVKFFKSSEGVPLQDARLSSPRRLRQLLETNWGCDTENPCEGMPTKILEECMSFVDEHYRKVVCKCATSSTASERPRLVLSLTKVRANVLRVICAFLRFSPCMPQLEHGDAKRAFLNVAHLVFKNSASSRSDIMKLQRQNRKNACETCYVQRTVCFDCRARGRSQTESLSHDNLVKLQANLVAGNVLVNKKLDDLFGKAWLTEFVITPQDFDLKLHGMNRK
ncbi:hypothetical protein CYMTET_41519 [Cymbomonas tetramitiformis]|uniref:Uncharacterized protein n=1 Tax=Cymbomonas tetramitiformis TaxID=36881 RepID=A0AAE0F3I7_9CHLO|nr:hypothetical protein CYMTET_41519 [Cymbomonas tetramitiformis]